MIRIQWCAWLLLPLVLGVAAADNSESEEPVTEAAAEQTVPAEADEVDPAVPAPESAGETPDTFVPSEDISEDLSVSYPVDI